MQYRIYRTSLQSGRFVVSIYVLSAAFVTSDLLFPSFSSPNRACDSRQSHEWKQKKHDLASRLLLYRKKVLQIDIAETIVAELPVHSSTCSCLRWYLEVRGSVWVRFWANPNCALQGGGGLQSGNLELTVAPMQKLFCIRRIPSALASNSWLIHMITASIIIYTHTRSGSARWYSSPWNNKFYTQGFGFEIGNVDVLKPISIASRTHAFTACVSRFTY